MTTLNIEGGDKLTEYLEELSRNVKTAASVDVGFMEGATEEDGTPVALVAALNEYGVPSRNQPPRPFFRRAIDNNADNWAVTLSKALQQTSFNALASLIIVAGRVKEDIEESIRTLTSPPLAASTIARKSRGVVRKIAGILGPAKPLIDTGTMLRSVTYKVHNEGEDQ